MHIKIQIAALLFHLYNLHINGEYLLNLKVRWAVEMWKYVSVNLR